MAKKEEDKQKTIVYKTQHRKLETKQLEPHQKTEDDLRCARNLHIAPVKCVVLFSIFGL